MSLKRAVFIFAACLLAGIAIGHALKNSGEPAEQKNTAGSIIYADTVVIPGSDYVSGKTFKLMLGGDSQLTTLGDGPRTALWHALRLRRSNFSFVGSQFGAVPADQTSPVGYLELGQGENEGHPGFTIAEWRDNSGALCSGLRTWIANAGEGCPDVAVMMLGTDDVSAYAGQIADGGTQGAGLALMKEDIASLDACWNTVGCTSTRRIYDQIPPWCSSTNTAQGAGLASAFNAWIAPVNGTSFNTAGLRTVAFSLSCADTQNDGVHLARSGLTAVGTANAMAVEQVAPYAPAGTPWPAGPASPPFTKRPGTRQASLKIADTSAATDFAQFPALSRAALGSGNFLIAGNILPIADPQNSGAILPAGLHTIFSSATATSGDVLALMANGPSTALYFPGSGSPACTDSNQPAWLSSTGWNQWVVWADKATLTATVYVNAVPVCRATVASWSFSGATSALLGYGSTNWAIAGSTGYYDTLLLATGSALPSLDNQLSVVEALYLRGTLPPGTTVLYKLADGSGTSAAEVFGGSAGTLASGGSFSTGWVASGTSPKPWDL